MSALAGVLCPPRWACLPICLPIFLHVALSSTLAGVLCPPRWACLPICLCSLPICFPSGSVFHLGWGAASASLGLSPVLSSNLSPTWLCLLRWLGCCVRLAGLVSGLVFQFVSHLAVGVLNAFLVCPLTGMLCPPRWACLRSCLPPCLPSGLGCCVRLAGFFLLFSVLSAILAGMLCPPRWAVAGLVSQLVSHLVWDALSASLVLCFSCLWSCLPTLVFVLSRSLSFIWDAVSAPPGLVFFLSLVLSPSLSPIWSGMLCPPLSFSCLRSCLRPCLPSWLGLCPPCWAVSGLVSQLVSHLVWDAVSASLVLSFSCLRSCLRSCLPSWLGCCVRLAGLSPVLSPSLSPIWSGMLCPPRWSCLSLVCGLVSGLVCHLGWDAVSASLGCLRSCLPACLPSGLGCCVRLAGLVFLLSAVLSPVLSAILAGMLCPPRWAVSGLVSQLVSHLVWDALSASLVLSFSCLWSCLVSQLLSLFCLVACLSSGMLCLPDVVFASLARLPAQLVSGLLSHPVFRLVWCVRALGLSPKFHVRFVQLFGVYGGVIFFN